MEKSADEIMQELHKLGRIKQKISRMNAISGKAFHDPSVDKVKGRLLIIQKLVSAILADCDKK